MKNRIIVWAGLLACLLLGVNTANAQTATPLDSLRWDYVDADLTTYLVDRFEMCFDGATTGCPTGTPDATRFIPAVDGSQGPPPAAGASAYKLRLPALTPGAHTVIVRACNTSGCGDSAPLSFTMQVQPPAATIRGFVPGLE